LRCELIVKRLHNDPAESRYLQSCGRTHTPRY